MDTIAVKRKNYNPGICLLKMLACFGVVNSHFGAHGGEIMTLPVPVFIFISIFMAYPSMLKGGVEKLKGRVYRLMMPFAFWGIFYFVAYSIFTRTFDLKLLFWQLLLGHTVCKPLYFLPLLLIYTVMAAVLSRFDKYMMFISHALIGISFFLQYAGINYEIFGSLPDELSVPLGRFVECLPAAMAACAACRYKLQVAEYNRSKVLGWSIFAVILYLMVVQVQLIPSCKGFGKQGLSLFVGTVVFCCAFIYSGSVLPQLKSSSVIRHLSDYTFGIYLLHVIVARFYEISFGRQRNYVESVAVFVFSAIFVALLMKIPHVCKIVK